MFHRNNLIQVQNDMRWVSWWWFSFLDDQFLWVTPNAVCNTTH